ncbi:MAG: DUF2225 domain-containing protein, partial [Fibrobacter sp.]|nr:DUF2225 domain-containing protein [Fibrobacter sp.]
MTIDVNEVKRRLSVLLNDPNMVNDYIRQYGPSIDIKHIRAIREARECVTKNHQEETLGEDPIFEIKLKCPVCNQDNITSYELRAKSQQVVQNRFLVPVYTGAAGFKTVDYNLIAVTVCPRCLFASPDKKDFVRQESSNHDEIKSQLGHNVIMTLQEKIGERKAILKTVTDFNNYFKRPRFGEPAIDSYKLAIARAKVEAWYEQPYSYYKLGAYCLKAAKILKDEGNDNTEQLQDALKYYEEAFRTSNCPLEEIEMQVIYVLVALYLKLGDQKKANSYIGVYTNLHNSRVEEMRMNPRLNTITIDRWADKA